jgi:hypothetical protein
MMPLSARAIRLLDLLRLRTRLLSGPSATGKSAAAAAWRELVAACLVTETEQAKGVARYEVKEKEG